MKRFSALGVVVATAFLCSAPITLHWSPSKVPSLAVDSASARIGRPLTPMSVAGVHRRGYYGAAAMGAAAVGAGVYNYYRRPACGYYPYPPCY